MADMKSLPFSLIAASAFGLLAAQTGANPFAGRWDLTIKAPGGAYPDWVEVTRNNGKLEALVQPRAGSVHPATNVKLDGSRLALTVSPATADRPAITWELAANGGTLSGTQKRGTEVSQVEGVRAPVLKHAPPSAWTDPEPLFNGKDLNGWEPDNPSNNHWAALHGDLVNQSKGANIRTTRKLDDFKVHVEFNCPQGGNSGVYLRGRYEIQVEYEPEGTNDRFHSMGAIYGFLAPAVELPKKPGQWESFDVTLVGRYLTVVRNGVKTIDNQEIPGITGGAIDSDEGQPGPIYIQGDHTGGMRYRNITIAVPKR